MYYCVIYILYNILFNIVERVFHQSTQSPAPSSATSHDLKFSTDPKAQRICVSIWTNWFDELSGFSAFQPLSSIKLGLWCWSQLALEHDGLGGTRLPGVNKHGLTTTRISGSNQIRSITWRSEWSVPPPNSLFVWWGFMTPICEMMTAGPQRTVPLLTSRGVRLT